MVFLMKIPVNSFYGKLTRQPNISRIIWVVQLSDMLYFKRKRFFFSDSGSFSHLRLNRRIGIRRLIQVEHFCEIFSFFKTDGLKIA